MMRYPPIPQRDPARAGSRWGHAVLCLLAVPAILASCANRPQVTEAAEQHVLAEPAPAVPADPPKHPLAYYHFLLGHQAELGKEAGQAIEEYLRALRRDPTSVFLKAKLASLYFGEGKVDDALRFADRVSETDGADSEVALLVAGVYAQAGKVEQALVMYDRAIQAGPENTDAHFSKGLLLVNLKRYEEAEAAFLRGIEFAQHNPIGYYYLGRIKMEQQDPAAAVGHYRRAVDLRPTFEPAQIALASAYEVQGDHDQAVAVYRRYLHEINPSSKEVRQRLVKLYLRKKDYTQALDLLGKTLEEDPQDLEALLRTSLIHGELKQYDRAIASLKQILAVRPGEVKIRDYLGLMYEESKKYEDAIETYRANLKLQPHYYDGRMHLGFLLYRLNRYDEAVPHLSEAVNLNPQKPDGFILLGLTHLQAERFEQALAAFQQGVRHNPSSPDLHFNLGTAYDKLDQFDEVVEAMNTALELDPEHADALNYLGYSYADRGINIEKALALTRRAVALKPNNGYYVDSLGWAFFKMGRLEDALKEIKRAATLVHDDPVIYEHLGEIYYKQDLIDQAIKAWQRSLQLDPGNEKLIERVRTRGLSIPPATDQFKQAIRHNGDDPGRPATP